MKKIIVLSLLTIFTCLSLTGCKNNDEIDSEIINFSYSYGSYNSGHYVYNITNNNDEVIFTAEGLNDVEMNINKKIDKFYLKELSKQINDNKIYKWDGFNKSDDDVLDGYSFSLTIEYDNGKTIKAHGYMKYPKNYDKGHKVLKEFLESIK